MLVSIQGLLRKLSFPIVLSTQRFLALFDLEGVGFLRIVSVLAVLAAWLAR